MTKLVKTNYNYPYFDIFNEFFNTSSDTSKMKTDIIEVENGYELHMDVPGFKKDDLKISLDNGYLKVKASKTEEKEEKAVTYLRRERFLGNYERSFYVGEEIAEEDISAKFDNGTLVLEIPKEGSKKQITKYIDIL